MTPQEHIINSLSRRITERENRAAVPEQFLESLINSYNYAVLQEVKEALYFYNEKRISKDIQNYLFAVNFDPGCTEKCIFTGELIDITEAFFETFEMSILGRPIGDNARLAFRKDIQNQYTARTLTQEMQLEGKDITATEVYNTLRERYVHNLKEKVMDPFLQNENFHRAVKNCGTDAFKAYDKRIQREIQSLIRKLKSKYDYSEPGAREIGLYVIDHDLPRAFAKT